MERKHSYFFTLPQDGSGTNLNLKCTFGPIRGNYPELYLIIGKVSQCALFSFSILNSRSLCFFFFFRPLQLSFVLVLLLVPHLCVLSFLSWQSRSHPELLFLIIHHEACGIPPSHLFSNRGFIEALLYRPVSQSSFQQEKEDMEGKNIESKQNRYIKIFTPCWHTSTPPDTHFFPSKIPRK